MILRDFQCESCGNVSEDWDPADECVCGGQKRAFFSYAPTSGCDVTIWSVLTKGSVIRQKLQGKLPWRKSSESQTD